MMRPAKNFFAWASRGIRLRKGVRAEKSIVGISRNDHHAALRYTKNDYSKTFAQPPFRHALHDAISRICIFGVSAFSPSIPPRLWVRATGLRVVLSNKNVMRPPLEWPRAWRAIRVAFPDRRGSHFRIDRPVPLANTRAACPPAACMGYAGAMFARALQQGVWQWTGDMT